MPQIDGSAAFRPLMLANPLDEAELAKLDPADFFAEWKWDGIRVQIVAGGNARRIYSRTGDEISRSFRSEEHTSELQSLMRISYAVFCLKKKTKEHRNTNPKH